MGSHFVFPISFLIFVLKNPFKNGSKALTLLYKTVLERVKTDKYQESYGDSFWIFVLKKIDAVRDMRPCTGGTETEMWPY